MRLDGKTALVTGARGGIGRAITTRFLREGATVYAVDLPGQGPSADEKDGGRFLPVDITAEDQVVAALARVRGEAGRLDILVNAAGIEIEKTVPDTTLEDWNRIFAVNVTGTSVRTTGSSRIPASRRTARPRAPCTR